MTSAQSGDRDILVASDAACGSCRIQMDSIATIGSPDGDGLGNFVLAARRDEEGYFYVSSGPRMEVAVFTPDGRLAGRIGRLGDGPGEFRSATILSLDSRGQLHVFDRIHARHSVYSREGNFRGAFGLPALAMRTADVFGDRVVINAHARDRDNAGYALLLVDNSGTVLRRLDEVPFDYRRTWLLDRSLSVSPSGHLVVAHTHECVIDIYDGDLRRILRVGRQAEWFKPPSPNSPLPSDGVFNVPPDSRLLTSWQDAEGLLWLVGLTPSERWKPGPSPTEAGSSGGVTQALEDRPRFDTIVEVIDVALGRVLARQRWESIDATFVDGYVLTAREAGDLTRRLVVSRLRLER
jgi:hypothetical protein